MVRSLQRQGAYTSVIDLKEGADYRFDVSDGDAYRQIFENMRKCDVFVNTAYPAGMLPHIKAFYVASKLIAEWMKKTGGGVIVNLSSIYGMVGSNPDLYKNTDMEMPAGYAMSKAGIIGLTRWLATNYGRHGIRANCICAGGVRNGQPLEFVRRYCERVPLGRMATRLDIAQAVIALVGTDYVTGVCLPVDGGLCVYA